MNDVINPYKPKNALAAPKAEAPLDAQRAIAEVKAAAVLAREFPRERSISMQRIMDECEHIELAKAAAYRYPRGDTTVTGPSIRLAEVLAMNWGNLQFGWEEIDRRDGMSEIVAYAWDVELNVRRATRFFIKHWRDTKKGGYALKDERDIYELCANQAMRRVRSCILSLIPKEVVETALAQCKKTIVENEPVTPERIEKMIKAFEQFGVTKAMIEKKLGKPILNMLGQDMIELMEVYTSLKDGQYKVEQFFEPEQAQETPHDPETGEVTEPSDWCSFVEELLSGVYGSNTEKGLDEYLAEIGDEIEKLQKSKDRKAIKKWATEVSRKRNNLKGDK